MADPSHDQDIDKENVPRGEEEKEDADEDLEDVDVNDIKVSNDNQFLKA